MNLKHIRFSLSVRDKGSFVAAAKECNVTQPSLSSGIEQIEKILGGRLFERTTRHVQMTAFGKHMMPFLEDIINAEMALQLQSKAFFEPEVKIIRIGSSPQIQSKAIAERLRKFRDIDLCFKQCFLDDLNARMLSDQIDISVEPLIPGQSEVNEIQHSFFFRESLFFIPAEGSTLKGKKHFCDVKDLSGITIALTHDGCGLAPLTRYVFRKENIQLVEYKGKALNYQALEDWAELGLASVILPESCISAKGMQYAIPLRIGELLLTIEYVLRRRRTTSRPKYLNQVYDALRVQT